MPRGVSEVGGAGILCQMYTIVHHWTQNCIEQQSIHLRNGFKILSIFFGAYDPCSEDEEYLMPTNVAEMTPGWSEPTAHLLTTTRLVLNSLPESPKICGQVNWILNHYHSNPMGFSSTLGILDITDWWRQQQEMHSKYANLSDVASNIWSIIPHGVGLGAKFSLQQDVSDGKHSKTIGMTLHEIVVVRQFAQANNSIV